MPIPTLIIAGTHSGSGKTTVTLAVLSALVRRGLRVQGFKVGPDFIDPGHHSRVTGRPGRNLDTWMLDPPALARTFRAGATGADIAVVEGVMGLFDGRGGGGPDEEAGSTADLARRWGCPSCWSSMLGGCRARSRPGARVRPLRPGGDRCGSGGEPGRRSSALCGLPPAGSGRGGRDLAPLGYLRATALAIPSRHLGLLTSDEFSLDSRFQDALADAAESSLDLDRLLALARPPHLPTEPESESETVAFPTSPSASAWPATRPSASTTRTTSTCSRGRGRAGPVLAARRCGDPRRGGVDLPRRRLSRKLRRPARGECPDARGHPALPRRRGRDPRRVRRPDGLHPDLARRLRPRSPDVGPDPGACRDAAPVRRARLRDGRLRPADPARACRHGRPGP